MVSSEVKSVILRFRDLGIPAGTTIRRHNGVIGGQKSVWWGWWAQGNEKVANDTYVALRALATSSAGLDVWLFDSGQKLVYRAHCVDLKWDAASPTPSPAPDLTPEYYRTNECKAWWKFTDVAESDIDHLREFSYVNIPEHFDGPEGLDYSMFDAKRVASADELHEQRRTVWFIRPFRSDEDRDHEIILIGGANVQPQDFTSEYAASASNRLLWLSDLHFSRDGNHNFQVAAHDEQRRTLAEAVKSAVQAADSAGGTKFAGIVVSGDLTFKADPGEFSDAVECLVQIAGWSGVRGVYEQRMGIAPGNHDIKFSATPETEDAPVTAAPAEARAAFTTFYRTLFHKSPDEYLCSGRRFLLGNSIPVEVAFLNSSILEQSPANAAPRFQGQGFVGERQLERVTEKLGWNTTPPGRTIRIVVLHHHLISGVYAEEARYGANYSTVLDSGRLQRWVFNNRVDLVLHGHQHEPYFARLSRPRATTARGNEPVQWQSVFVVGMGSSGIVKTKRPDNVPNMFATLTFSAGRVAVDMYTVDPVQASQPLHRVVLELVP